MEEGIQKPWSDETCRKESIDRNTTFKAMFLCFSVGKVTKIAKYGVIKSIKSEKYGDKREDPLEDDKIRQSW